MKKNKWLEWIKFIMEILVSIIYIYPIILILISSVKSGKEIAKNTFGWPQIITIENFIVAFKRMNYFQTLLNTFMIAVCTIIFALLFSSMAGYAIARKGKRYAVFYYLFLSGLLVPFYLIMIPLYKLLMTMHMINNIPGIIVLYVATQCPGAVFFLTGFVKSIPQELEDAAYIDGAGIYQTFFKIDFPLLQSSLVSLGLLTALRVWNDFLMPMIFLQSREKLTLTVTLSNFQGQYYNNWSLIFAGVVMISIPIIMVYFLGQKYIINGIAAGSVKG